MQHLAAVFLLIASVSVAAEPGRDLFEQGAGAEVLLANGKLRLSAEKFACANCHGADGTGRQEGTAKAPAIRWSALTGTDVQKKYNRETFSRAVFDGLAQDGRRLNQTMPRFIFNDVSIEQLIDYLKQLDNEQLTGIGPKTIRLLAPVNPAVADGLADAFTRFNFDGGAFGRTLKYGDAEDVALAGETLVKKVRARLNEHSVTMLIRRIRFDGHKMIKLSTGLDDSEMVFRLRRDGIIFDQFANPTLIVEPIAETDIFDTTIYAPLPFIRNQLPDLLNRKAKLTLAVPTPQIVQLALKNRKGSDYLDGLIGGMVLGDALLSLDRTVTKALILDAIGAVDVGSYLTLTTNAERSSSTMKSPE